MEKLVCIDDFHRAAVKLIDQNSLEYFESGADDEFTVKENQDAFRRWIVRPRVLRNIATRNLSTSIFGKPIFFPIAIAPMAMQKLAHRDGELAIAKAAARMGTVYVMSTLSTCSIEEVSTAVPKGRHWFQLYFHKDLQINKNLLSRAEACGFEAVVLTADNSMIGKRRVNLRNCIKLPEHLELANFNPKNKNITQSQALSKMRDNSNPIRDQSVTWDVISWLRRMTRMKIIIKGILTAEDALLAVKYGADAIIVSNHGGRQLDCVLPSICALEDIVKVTGHKCEVYMDGGVTKGSDVFKALAIGAKMIFVGRAIIWGLAVGGEAGVQKSLQILKDELEQTMALSGISSIGDIDRSYIGRHPLYLN